MEEQQPVPPRVHRKKATSIVPTGDDLIMRAHLEYIAQGRELFKPTVTHYVERHGLQLPLWTAPEPPLFQTTPVDDDPLIPPQGGGAQNVPSIARQKEKMVMSNEDNCTEKFDDENFTDL
ncbi:hypothetical protein GOBAR_DD12281 [Gossypium barbadense]|nr:hypothetical protein GOBAR_DD12281 [Gossypium barbadense]